MKQGHENKATPVCPIMRVYGILAVLLCSVNIFIKSGHIRKQDRSLSKMFSRVLTPVLPSPNFNCQSTQIQTLLGNSKNVKETFKSSLKKIQR